MNGHCTGPGHVFRENKKREALQAVPAVHATWKEWKALYPESVVLEKEGVYRSSYEDYNRDRLRLGIFGRRMNRSALPPKERILGVRFNGAAARPHRRPGNRPGAWAPARFAARSRRSSSIRSPDSSLPIDHYVADAVQHFLRRWHKAPTRGTRRFGAQHVFGQLGVLCLESRVVRSAV